MSLKGFVFVDINQNGLQDGIEPPVPGQVVVLTERNGVELITITDQDGMFEISGVPRGSFTIRPINEPGKQWETGFLGTIVQVPIEPTAVSTATPTPTEEVPVTQAAAPPTTSSRRMEVTYPLEMFVEATEIVTVEIIADPRFAEIGVFEEYITGVISIEIEAGDGERGRIEDQIRLYPVMSAELIAASFTIASGNANNQRIISATYPASWTWTIAATKPGIQKIIINIFGEATLEGETFTILEMSKSRNINVLQKPFIRRILEGLVNNVFTIWGTGGPLGLLIAYLKYKSDQKNKELEREIESLKNTLIEHVEKPGSQKEHSQADEQST